MPNAVLVMDYANMFCGSDVTDDSASNHLILTEVKLPSMEVQYSDHRAGGAPIYIEIATGIARLECTFVLVGITPQVKKLVDSWIPSQRNFFVYGNVRDQHTGQAIQAAAAFTGQLGRADIQNFRKGDVMHTNYSIRLISHYEFGMAGNLVYYWDFFTNTRFEGGLNKNQEINDNLHINSPAPEFLLNNFAIPFGGGA